MELYLKNKITISNPTAACIAFCDRELTFTNPEYAKKEKMGKWLGRTQREIVLYERNGDEVLLPFGMFKRFYAAFRNDLTGVHNRITPVRARKYDSGIKLYDYQETAVEAAIKARNGVLVAPCGSGKTQMGLEIAARIGGKTLWVTHTLDLLNQSLSRAKAVYGMDKEEYGTITEGKVNIGNTITFATVQTLANVDLSQFTDTWDCVIVDECHKCVGSPTNMMMFYRVLSALSARYKIGLTATPYRSDGLEKSMFAILGDVFYTVPQAAVKTCPVRVKFVPMDGCEIDPDTFTDGDGTIVYNRLIAAITKNEWRNAELAWEIYSAAKNGATLVLSDRIEHLDELYRRCSGRIPTATLARLGAATTKSEKERRNKILKDLDNGELNVVFATYKLAKEGIDVPNLRTVVFATPQKDKATVIQAAGRVARAAENKRFGTIIDTVDPISMFYWYAKKRKSYYERLGYEIDES